MNNTQLHIQQQTFSLKRFPTNKFDKSLRAWDAADEYMIDYISENFDLTTLQNIVIVNDSFGALTCAMSRLAPNASIQVFTDSFMSQQAIMQNLKGSNLDKNKVTVNSSLTLFDMNTQQLDIVLIKVPRTLAYLEYLVNEISAACNMAKDASIKPVIIGGAMVKLITSSVMKVFTRTWPETRSTLARKKSRLVFVEINANYLPVTRPPLVNQVEDNDIGVVLHNYPNVFCREQVDIGARFLLSALPVITKNQQLIIDLGCGNGILGVSLLQQADAQGMQIKVVFVDESYMAIASAKATLHNSNVSQKNKAQAEFLVSHSLSEYIKQSSSATPALQAAITDAYMADNIICNPPFHQQNTIIDDIAWQMFSDAKKALKLGGELRIVGNRHLDHQVKLRKIFGACKVVASDNKFVVLSAVNNAGIN